MKLILHGDVARSDVGDHLGDEEWVVFGALLGTVHGIISGLFFKSVQTTDACCHDYTHAVAVEVGCFEKIGVGYGLTGCDDAILGIEVELTEFLAVEVIGCVVALDFACKLGLEFRSVEMGDESSTADAGEGVGPCGGHIVADRCYSSESCDYNSFKFHCKIVV